MRKLFIIILFVSAIAGAFAQSSKIADFNSKPSLLWKFHINTQILGSPAVSENLVYFGGVDSTLYALDLSSGKISWKFRTKGAIRSTVLVSGNNLYVNGGDGNLYSLDCKTGKVKWTFIGNGERKYDFADYHHSSPVLYKGKIYFGAGDEIFAIDEKGAKVWSFKTGGPVHATPAFDNDKLFVGSFDGYVYALNAADGSQLWKFKTVGHRFFPKGEVQGSPTAFNGQVFVGARDYNVYALDQEKGFSLWNKSYPRGWMLVNTVQDSVLYMAGADERFILSLNPTYGRELWRQTTEMLTFGKPAFTENIIYTGTTIGKLYARNIKTGEKTWSFSVDAYEKNHLKYFKEDDSYRDDLYSIIKSNEEFLEMQYELGGIFSSPVLTANHIVFTCSDGTVYCLKR